MIVVVCSGLIVDELSGKVLLVHEKKVEKYGLPGGKLESKESLRECLSREYKEELGMAISIDDLVLISEKPSTHEGNTVIRFFYRAKITDKIVTPELEYDYYSQEEIDNLTKQDKIRGKDVAHLLKEHFQGKLQTYIEPIMST